MTDATEKPDRTTFADQADTLQAALRSLFSGKPSETEADLSRLFTPNFKHYDEDEHKIRDFTAWVAHIRWVREIIQPIQPGSELLTIKQFLRDGNQLAERHTATTKLLDGTVSSAAHSFLFMEIADDGRIEWIVETVKHQESVKDGSSG